MGTMTSRAGLILCCLSAGCATADLARFTWGLQQEGSSVSLIYGESGTDNIGYRFNCIVQSGTFEISGWMLRPPPGPSRHFPTRMRVNAGGESFDLAAQAEVTDVGDRDTVVTAEAPERLLAALSRGSRLETVTYDGSGRAPAPARAQLQEFSRLCGIRV